MSSQDRDHVVLLHLSDIHFCTNESATAHDPHRQARHELIKDATTLVAEHGSPDVVVVSGDISSAAQAVEFDMAYEWLGELCTAIGTKLGSVVTVPGNHDVDCEIIHSSPMIKGTQRALRDADETKRDTLAREYLLDEEAVSLLLRSHHAYNEFAARFECQLYGSDGLYWDRNLELNDGSKLRLRGMTSTLCSDYAEDKYGNLFINESQYTFLQEPDVVHAAICHHPPEWTSVSDKMNDGLSATRLQLFGHKHLLRPKRIDEAIRIGAGAVQPDGVAADHLRAYSLIKLRVDVDDDAREMSVDVLPRRWRLQPPVKFESERNEEGGDIWHYRLSLPQRTPIPDTRVFQPMTQNHAHPDSGQAKVPCDAAIDPRALFIRFFALAYSRRFEVCGKLDLITPEDGDLPDYQKFVLALRRAIDGGQSDEISQAISEVETRSS